TIDMSFWIDSNFAASCQGLVVVGSIKERKSRARPAHRMHAWGEFPLEVHCGPDTRWSTYDYDRERCRQNPCSADQLYPDRRPVIGISKRGISRRSWWRDGFSSDEYQRTSGAGCANRSLSRSARRPGTRRRDISGPSRGGELLASTEQVAHR